MRGRGRIAGDLRSNESRERLGLAQGEGRVGSGLGEANADQPGGGFAVLRLGLHGLGKAPQRWSIAVNGQRIYERNGEDVFTRVTGRAARPSRLQPPASQAYLQVPLTDRRMFHLGRNELSVSLSTREAKAELQIVETQIGVMVAAP